MGTHFFQKKAGGNLGPSNLNLEARAIGAPSFAGKSAGMGAQKALGAAMKVNQNKEPLAKSDRSGVYPKGPKL